MPANSANREVHQVNLNNPLTFEVDQEALNSAHLELRVTNEGIKASDIGFKVEDSEDGVSFADVSGSAISVTPRGEKVLALTVRKFFRYTVTSGDGRVQVERSITGGSASPVYS